MRTWQARRNKERQGKTGVVWNQLVSGNIRSLPENVSNPQAWKYYQSGSDDEVTRRNNRAAFERIRLRPRMLVNSHACDLRITALGSAVSMPIFIAPTAFHCLAYPEGECATAQAADKAGTLMVADYLIHAQS